MSRYSNNPNITERTVMAVLLVLLLFLSPMTEFWAALDAPWYSPYLSWAVAIFISWLLQRHLKEPLDKQ